MAPGRIGVGIIGAGNWAGHHAASYGLYPEKCRVVAFADIDKSRADSRAREAGAEAGYADYRELLARPDIQLVSICTPPFEHSVQALAALNAGKHVLCEKPLATSLEECDQMLDTASKNGLLLGGVLQNRMFPAVLRAKALIDSGAVGGFRLAVATGMWWRGPEYFAVPWRGTWEKEGGGTLLNHHSHLLDVLLHLVGDPAEVCAATAVAGRKMEVEDVATLNIRFRNGMLASAMASSCAHHGETSRLELACEKAGFTIGLYGAPLQITCSKSGAGGMATRDGAAEQALLKQAEEMAPTSKLDGLDLVIANMLEAVQGTGKLLVSGGEARRVLELVFASYKSSVEGGWIKMPLQKNDVFYSKAGVIRREKAL
jgi:predicted dehydrogenase